ncbi:MAG: DUF4130 domain-containing protein [Candidatus Hodarchaeales archaeon]|jgi:hypothetical protein
MYRKIEKKKVLDSLSRHKDVTTDFLNQIKHIPKEILENKGNDLARKAVTMSQEVDSDLHAHKAFLRFSVSPYGILYAKSDKMNHENEETLLQFFQNRFPTFIVLFESNRGVFTLTHDLILMTINMPIEKVLKEFEEKLPLNPMLTDLNEKNYEELWKCFAQSQIIQGRRTSKQIVNLSKKWRGTVAEETSPKKLDVFFKS